MKDNTFTKYIVYEPDTGKIRWKAACSGVIEKPDCPDGLALMFCDHEDYERLELDYEIKDKKIVRKKEEKRLVQSYIVLPEWDSIEEYIDHSDWNGIKLVLKEIVKRVKNGS
jgi:hypothetical protein